MWVGGGGGGTGGGRVLYACALCNAHHCLQSCPLLDCSGSSMSPVVTTMCRTTLQAAMSMHEAAQGKQAAESGHL